MANAPEVSSGQFDAAGRASKMKLNGWQRLWVLLAVLWLLPVAFIAYELWPTAAFVSKGDVYARLKGEADLPALKNRFKALLAQP